MDNPLESLRVLLLGVLAGPLVAAAAVALAGRLGPTAARRLAVSCALVHLAVTAALALLAAGLLTDRSGWADAQRGVYERSAFQPLAVPGDPGSTADASGQIHDTTWTLLSVSAAKAGLPGPDVRFFVGLDGLNLWLVLLTSLLTLVAVLVSWDAVTDRPAAFYAWLFVLETGILGAFLSFDLVLFYVFFELTLIPAFFLIGHWGSGGQRRDAARKFFLYTLAGSLLTLVGVVGVVLANPTPVVARGTADGAVRETVRAVDDAGRPTALKPGPVTFSLPRLMVNVQVWERHRAAVAAETERLAADARRRLADATDRAAGNEEDAGLLAARSAVETADQARDAAASDRDYHKALQLWLFLALMAGFAVKTPIVPFHTWLPAAYNAAPMGVTLLLSGLLAKLGTFGILRVVLPLSPDAAFEYGLPVFGLLGAVGVVYAAFCAFAQRDAKLMVAYSSVSHLGLLVLGLFAVNREGLTGAALHMVNHGLSTGALFGLLGFLSQRYGTLEMSRYGGLIGRFPGYAFLVFVVALAGVGLPGLNNFVSEMLILAGLFDPTHTASMGYGLAAAGAAGIFLSAWYTMTMLKTMFFGPAKEPPTADGRPAAGMTGREAVAFGLPAALCLALGLYPQPVLDTIRPDVNVIVRGADAARVRAGYAPSSDTRPKPADAETDAPAP